MKEYLYSPVRVYIAYENNSGNYFEDELCSAEAVEYQSDIDEAIDESMKTRVMENGKMVTKDDDLMHYFDVDYCSGNKELENSVKEKVISARPNTSAVNNELYCVMEIEVKEPLNKNEINALKEYFKIVYSDTWGDFFEENGIETDIGYMCVDFRPANKFFIDTTEEFEERLGCQLQKQSSFELSDNELEIDNDEGMKFNM